MKKAALLIYLKDKLIYILSMLALVVLFIILMTLERYLNDSYVPVSTMIYYVILAVLGIFLWLAFDYIRLRDFYKELQVAVENMTELRDTLSLHTVVTEEQKLYTRLLQKMHTAYLNEQGRYRRKQEQHNHFVLQWVHHMKTPVSVIDLLTQTDKNNGQLLNPEELVPSIREENERLARGLEMMLHTARLEKFEFDLHVRMVALHVIARHSINEHKRICIQHAIFPKIIGEAFARTDEKWMTFMINQLLSNAIKYSKHKPGTKQLVVHLQTEGDMSSITIEDQGVGIAAHDLKRIFDPFFTGENGRTVGESTGMGLYLTKQVCDKLGHELIVQSIPEQSTSVTIRCKADSIHMM